MYDSDRLRRMTWLDWARVALAIVLTAFLIGIVVFAVKARLAEIAKCKENGGQWLRYNCRNVTTTTCTGSMDDGSFSCSTSTYEQCDEKCFGANAEDAR